MKMFSKYAALWMVVMGFSVPAFATEETDADIDEGLMMIDEAAEELAMSKKSSEESAEYDYRGNRIEGKAKRKKGSYPSPISRKNTSSNDEDSYENEEADDESYPY